MHPSEEKEVNAVISKLKTENKAQAEELRRANDLCFTTNARNREQAAQIERLKTHIKALIKAIKTEVRENEIGECYLDTTLSVVDAARAALAAMEKEKP
jgi:hypothetical protein